MLTIASDDLPDNLVCIVCRHVLDGQPIHLVARSGDGDLQFPCGGGHEAAAAARAVGLGEVDMDGQEFAALLPALLPGTQAVRSGAGAEWRVSSYEE